MKKTRRPLPWLIGCTILLVGGCGSASGSSDRGGQQPRLIREPVGQIARGSNSTILLIDVAQDTRDRSSRCFVHYTTRVVTETTHLIKIELLRPNPEAQPFRCTANAVRGPFLVPVHLKRPYRGQKLVDATTGRRHTLTPRSQLS